MKTNSVTILTLALLILRSHSLFAQEHDHDHDHDHDHAAHAQPVPPPAETHGDHGDHDDHDHDHAAADPHEGHDDHEGHDHARAEADDHGTHDDHAGHAHGEDEEDGVHLTDEVAAEFGITTGPAGPGVLGREWILPGTIHYNREHLAYVTPRFAGTITAIQVRLGDRVEKGQVLARLESNDTLRPFELIAPIAGQVVAFDLTPGESVEAGARLFTLADLATVWADLRVYPQDLSHIRPGMQVRILGAVNAEGTPGVIDYLSPVVDEHTRTGLARVVVDNGSGSWKPGLFVRGVVSGDGEKVPLLLPASALIEVEGESVVFVKSGEMYEPRPVQVGRADRDQVEILGGVAPGEQVVVTHVLSLKAEMSKSSFGGHAGHVH